jgi:fumarylacetoacetase
MPRGTARHPDGRPPRPARPGRKHGSEGSFIELTSNGEHPIGLADGSTRTFLEDDDEVVLRGRAGELELAEVRGRILPARVSS